LDLAICWKFGGSNKRFYRFRHSQKYILKVIVADGKFEGYVDGQLIREWSDNRFKQGAVSMAFCCDASKVVFDDFVISGNDVPNSELAVSHQEKLTVCGAKIKGN